MKIAFILPSLDHKGPIVAAQNLIKSLVGKVEKIEVFYFNDVSCLDMGVKATKISFFKKYDLTEFDIVNSYMAKADLYTAIFFRNDNNVVTTMHNYLQKDLELNYGRLRSYVYKFIWKLALKNKKSFIFSSSDMLNYYQALLGTSFRHNVIEYGVEKKVLEEIDGVHKDLILNLKEKYILLGSIGLLIKRKGYAQLIELLVENKNYAVVIVGGGEELGSLMNLAEKYNISHRLLLCGFKSNSSDYYKYFDIYIMTSYSEGLSLAMLEALSHSLPLVCSDIENHRSSFNEEEVSFFELDNINSLDKAIEKINSNLEYYKDSSYSLWKEKFSLDAMGGKHISFFKSIIGNDK